MSLNSQNNVSLLIQLAQRAMHEHGLLIDFPPEVIGEVAKLDQAPSCSSQGKSRDMRDKLFFSIDNDDSRDLDQLTYAEILPNQRTKAYVAVADVDSVVYKNSNIDRRAEVNTTSVYTPGKVFPMLPERLSTDLTSLNPNAERRAIVVEMIVEANGSVKEYDVYPACVYNHAQLAYPSVAQWLDGLAPPPKGVNDEIAKQLRLQDQIATLIQNFRHSQGALTLQTIEMQPVIRDNQVMDLQPILPDRAHSLIENFMIAANVAVTLFLTGKKFPTLRRVVRTPKQWNRVVEYAAQLGTSLPDAPDVKALEAFLIKRKKADPTTFTELSLTMIKLLGRGEYVAEFPGDESIGHFDLALRDYAHTTAPNRRYPDLVMQRLLKQAMVGGEVPYTAGELKAIGTHCTIKEDDASKVERQLKKSAAAMLLSTRIGETFDALVTGSSNRGTWVRLMHPVVEGRLAQNCENCKVGDKVRVKLISVDIEKGFIDFARVKNKSSQ